jgi:WD40 repeat protein
MSPDLPPSAPFDAQNPYPGLSAFREKDVSFFFGRAREQQELAQAVRRETATVLYGVSGLGKTSLLQAGLFPLLRQEGVLPIPLRLDFSKGAASLVEQVFAAVAREVREQQLEAEPPRPGETLWAFFHRVPFWDTRNRPLVPLLAIDQFEELFTLGARSGAVAPFLTELADLVENRIPERLSKQGDAAELPPSFARTKAKVIVALREDYLPRLDDLRALLPTLATSRYRLRRMNGEQALEAVLKPGHAVVTEEVAREVVRFVAAGAKRPLTELEVEPALLALVCHELNERRRQLGLARISADLLSGESSRVLSTFYARAVADMGPRVRDFLEERLLTEDGYRTTVALADALRARGITPEVISTLVDRRLLRQEDRLDIPHIELVHDVMTGILRESRAHRRARVLVRRRLAAAGAVLALVLALAGGGLAWVASKSEADAERRQRQTTIDALAREARRQLDSDSPLSAGALLSMAWREAQAGGLADPALAVSVARAAHRLDGHVALLQGHTSPILGAAFSADGSRVATYSLDGVVVWNTEDGSRVARVDPWRVMPLKAPAEPMREGGSKAPVQPESGAAPGPSAVPAGEVRRDGAHRDEARAPEELAAALDATGRKLVTLGVSGHLVLWDLESLSPRVLATADVLEKGRPDLLLPLELRFVQGGQALLAIEERQRLLVFPLPKPGHTEAPAGAQRLKRGAWDVEDRGQVPTRLRLEEAVLHRIYEVATDPSGERLATAAMDRRVSVWSLREKRLLAELPHPDEVNGVAFDPTGSRLASACDDGVVRLWQADDTLGKRGPAAILPHGTAVYRVGFSVNGAHLYAVAGRFLRIWELATMTPLTQVNLDGGFVEVVPVDGALLVLTKDKRVLKISVPEGAVRQESILGGMLDQPALRLAPRGARALSLQKERADLFDLAAARPDRFITRGSPALTNPISRAETGLPYPEWLLGVSPDGQRVLLAGQADSAAKARLFELRDGQLRPICALPHRQSVINGQFDGTGRYLLTTDRSRSASLWDASTCQRLAVVGKGPEQVSRAVAFGNTGRWFATGGLLGRICLWSLPGAQRLRCFSHSDKYVDAIAFSADDHLLGVMSEDGRVSVWRTDSNGDSPLQQWTGKVSSGVKLFFLSAERVAASWADGRLETFDLGSGARKEAWHGAEGWVTCLAEVQGTPRILTYGFDGVAHLWSLDLEQVATLRGLHAAPYDCAISPQQEVAALSGQNGRTALWDLRTGERLLTLGQLGEDARTVVGWMGGGRYVAVAREGSLTLWPVVRMAPVGQEPHGAAVKQLVFAEEGTRMASTDAVGDVRVWSVAEGRLLERAWTSTPVTPGSFRGEAFQPTTLTLSGALEGRAARGGTGTRLQALHPQAGSSRALAVASNGEWWLVEGNQPPQLAPSHVRGHSAKVASLEFSPDSQQLFTSGDGRVLVWNTHTLTRVSELRVGEGLVTTLASTRVPGAVIIAATATDARVWRVGQATEELQHVERVNELALAPAGDLVLTRSGTQVRALELLTGRERYTLSYLEASLRPASSADRLLLFDLGGYAATPPTIYRLSDGAPLAVLKMPLQELKDAQLSPDGSWVVALSKDKRTAVLYSAMTGRNEGELAGTGPLNSVAFTRDGARVLTAGRNGIIRVFDVKTRREEQAIPPASTEHEAWDIRLSEDGKRMAVLYSALFRQWVDVLELDTGRHIASLEYAGSQPNAIRLSPDGRFVAAAYQDGAVRLFDVQTQKHVLTVPNEREVAARYTSAGPRAVTVDQERRLVVWDVSRGEHLRAFPLPEGELTVAELDAAGTHVLVGMNKGVVRLHDVHSGTNRELTACSGEVTRARALPQDEAWLVGCEDGTVHLWRGEQSRVLRGHSETITALEFSPDGSFLLTASEDGSARLWSGTGRLVDILTGQPGPVRAAAFSPKGDLLAAGGDHGWVRTWDLAPLKDDAETIVQRFNRALPQADE